MQCCPREYHKRPEYEFDLTRTFPNDPGMHMVNAILDKCVVERPDECLPSALELLGWIDEALGIIRERRPTSEGGRTKTMPRLRKRIL